MYKRVLTPLSFFNNKDLFFLLRRAASWAKLRFLDTSRISTNKNRMTTQFKCVKTVRLFLFPTDAAGIIGIFDRSIFENDPRIFLDCWLPSFTKYVYKLKTRKRR